VARAFKAADDAATPPTISEPTSTTGHHWLTPPDIIMGESSSSALDLNNPHWTETQQQQLLHEMRIPPQPHTTPEETTPVEEIKIDYNESTTSTTTCVVTEKCRDDTFSLLPRPEPP
jgi:hypothetical protein